MFLRVGLKYSFFQIYLRNAYLQLTMQATIGIAEILEFMMKKNIPMPSPILSPVPTRPVLLERIKLFRVEKEYFVDNLIRRHGHEVLRLPLYHCVLNAIELAWSKLKRTVRSENVFTEQPDKVMHLIKKVCDEN